VKRRKIDLAELVNERWILLPQNEFPGLLVTNAFRSVGLTPPRATIFSIHMRDRLLATGRYLSVVPNSVLHFAGDRLSFKALPVKLELEVQPRPVAVVTLRNRTLSPVARLFIEHARRLTRSLARQSSRHSSSAS
jgi:DNA-binding transcriptional LysR family regulator